MTHIQGRLTEDGIDWRSKADIAIARLQQFEPEDGYYLAFSGGKDSMVIYDLAIRAGVKFDAHYSLTGIDPPELVRFIREHYPNVERHRPKKTMWVLIEEKRLPPTRVVRYCCDALKEQRGKDRMIVTGVRWAESARRSKRRMVEQCLRGGHRTFVNPTIDWTDADVWAYIRGQGLPYCSLYDEGFKRLGCIMCPMQGPRGMLRDAERWPRIYNLYLRAFGRMLDAKRARDDWETIKWHTAEDVMKWWIHCPPRIDPDQATFFE